ncbi:MAG: hypothetical protein A2464_11470 [Deltaproteobacteria bacterium RIFOXYC2_FULL_48_10]|nr:MAG: hypothetical protein A2464_11470 [Deltaproteobacteria bacterium RIFOXYC2_FULL_48_10]
MLKFSLDQIPFLGGLFVILQLINRNSKRGAIKSYLDLPFSCMKFDIAEFLNNPSKTLNDFSYHKSKDGLTIRKVSLTHLIVSNILPWLIYISLAFYSIAFCIYLLDLANTTLITFNYSSTFWSTNRFVTIGFFIAILYYLLVYMSDFYNQLHSNHPGFNESSPWKIILGISFAKNED